MQSATEGAEKREQQGLQGLALTGEAARFSWELGTKLRPRACRGWKSSEANCSEVVAKEELNPKMF